MSRLIDAEKLEEVILNLPLDELADGFTFKSYRFVIDSIHKQPTIDPVKHAHWIDGVYNKCSRCGKEMYPTWDYTKTPYCPYCGAKMDEEMRK